MRPLVLVSNDDGYRSSGIRALRDALAAWADVVVVAPETEQSATSHSLSLHRPLRIRAVQADTFAIDGTPADSVYVALHAGNRFLPRWPDLVCSGINRGLNLGQDAFYSGTIAAAREGALRGIPAIAASAHVNADLARVAELTSKLARGLYDLTLEWNGEVKQARLGARIYDEVIDFRTDPRGREYLWLGGPGVSHARDEGTDTDAYDDGYASITPLVLDLTSPRDSALAEQVIAAAKLG